ncbi:MAG: hypothetical protein JO368_01965, partial [Acidimicrobiales bacterium]|nr:hypothetical protein [Acidimicrobiales bacterium]
MSVTSDRCYDADNHLREARDSFAKYMDPKYRELGWRLGRGPDGEERLFVNGQPLDDSRFVETPIAGTLRDNFRRLRRGESLDPFVNETEPLKPEYQDRDARLALMDRQGLEAILLFGNLPVSNEWIPENDPPQLYANLRAMNRYLEQEWGWSYKDRIYTVAAMSLVDLELAIEELDCLRAQGVRFVNLIPGPQG